MIDDISIPEIAEKLGISHYYLLHLFKSVMGTTIIEYRNTLRLTKSKFLLIGSEKSIADIATEVGFSSPSYFTEIFTANETISPTEYRKFHKN